MGRSGIREGIVRNADLRADAIATVLWHAWDLGLGTAGLIPSPILGGQGNHEYVVWLRAAGDCDGGTAANPTDWLNRITEIAGA